MNTFLLLLAGVISTAAPAAEVSVRAIQPGAYELVLTNPTALSEGEARDQIAKVASSVCKSATAVLGKWRYTSSEVIGGVAPSSAEPNTYRFVQEVSCIAGAQGQSPERLPTLRNEEEAKKVQNEVRLKSEAYFRLIASRRVDEVLTHMTAALRMSINEAKWKSDKLSFQAMAGEPLQISITKITVYDNPANAPEPGLYVAADYSNVYRKMPIHCGFLMWFRPIGGEFRVTREETGHVTSEQLGSIPSAQLPEVKRKLRCVPP
jgi:hypothetical protein